MVPLMMGGAEEEMSAAAGPLASGDVPALGVGYFLEQRVVMNAADQEGHAGDALAGAGANGGGSGGASGHKGPATRLTEFLDLATLQDIQDSLAMVAQVKASILDTSGHPLTQTTVSERFSNSSEAIAAALKQK